MAMSGSDVIRSEIMKFDIQKERRKRTCVNRTYFLWITNQWMGKIFFFLVLLILETWNA